MVTSRFLLSCLVVVCVTALSIGLPGVAAADPVAASNGTTRIAKWKDDKKGAFLLNFDDSLESQMKNAVPELKKRNLVATFYVVAGGSHWSGSRSFWEGTFPQECLATGMEYGNHTFTHSHARDVADFDAEIAQCNNVILKLFPGREPRLISYAHPGGVKNEDWTITAEQENESLAKHHLFTRVKYDIAAVGYCNSVEHLMNVVHDAIKSGSARSIVFHGVGGNYLSMSLPMFTEFLDKLASVRDQVWITTAIPEYKYAAERDGAAVKVLQADANQIRLQLTSTADAALYDYPLTLITLVPAVWKQCLIVQGATRSTAQVVDGAVRYDALPTGEPIVIQAGG